VRPPTDFELVHDSYEQLIDVHGPALAESMNDGTRAAVLIMILQAVT
jgi:hypothetical protein